MRSADGDRLRDEQSKLHVLAEEIRTLLDKPAEIAADKDAEPDSRWQGPNAEQVRGQIRIYQGKLRTMAEELDTEASKRGRDASTADQKKNQ